MTIQIVQTQLYIDYSGGSLDGANYVQTTDYITGSVSMLESSSMTAVHVLTTGFNASMGTNPPWIY